MSVLDRSALPHDQLDAIQQDLTARRMDVEGIEHVMFDGFSASS